MTVFSAGRFLALTSIAFMSSLTSAQEPSSMSVQLGTGVVVEAAGGRVYVMSAVGNIEAIGLESGQLIWTAKGVATPLGTVNDLLIVHVESDDSTSLTLVALESATGKRTATVSVPLPVGVRPDIEGTLGATFSVSFENRSSIAVISWKYTSRSVSGVAPPQRPQNAPGLPGGAGRQERPSTQVGRFSWNPMSGETKPVEENGQAEKRNNPGRRIGAFHVPSVDRRHSLTSRRLPDVRGWQNFQVKVQEADSGRQVAEFENRLPISSYCVCGSLLVYQTQAFQRKTADGMQHDPLKVRVLDIQSGRELWNRELKDTKYRGPFVP